MNEKDLEDILSQHADQLAGVDDSESSSEGTSTEDEELAALMDVAQQLQSTLTHIAPDTRFESDLKRKLLTTAHLRQAEGYVPPNPERDLLFVVAAFSVILGALGILFILRSRR